jgi:RNAse (barnase) inhibitor barstar
MKVININKHQDYLCFVDLRQIEHTQFFDVVTDSTSILKGHFAYKNNIRVLNDRVIFIGYTLSYAAAPLPSKKTRSLELYFVLLDQQGRQLREYELPIRNYQLRDNFFAAEFNDVDYQYSKSIRRDIDFMLRLKYGHIRADDWKKLNTKGKQFWLEWAYQLHPTYADQQLKETVHLDGRAIHSCEDFFCCIGEQINGCLGYFGRNYSALSDCLDNAEIWGAKSPLTIVWHNFSISKKNFLQNRKEIQLEWILEILNKQANLLCIN